LSFGPLSPPCSHKLPRTAMSLQARPVAKMLLNDSACYVCLLPCQFSVGESVCMLALVVCVWGRGWGVCGVVVWVSVCVCVCVCGCGGPFAVQAFIYVLLSHCYPTATMHTSV